MKQSSELTYILKHLSKLSGFRISIYDTNFNEIYSYPSEPLPFCALIHTSPQGKEVCKDCDQKAFSQTAQSGRTFIYQCDFGLYEATAPIYNAGILTGYMMMGQTLDTLASSAEFSQKKAAGFISSKESILDAIQKTPKRSREQIQSCISIMEICAEYITLSRRLQNKGETLSQKVKKYIDNNYGEKITIDLLCAFFFVSRGTLTAGFKKEFGMTINHYINTVRIDRAKLLLAQRKFSVREISEQCGFSDQNYFSKVFSRHTGLSPLRYREQSENVRER